MLSLPVVLSGFCLVGGCRDNPIAAERPAGGAAKLVSTMVCEVDVRARNTTCRVVRDGHAERAGAPRLTIVQDAQAMVHTGTDAYTPADSTYRLNVRLVNTSNVVLGSRDGVTVSGMKAFLPVNVMGYAGRVAGDTTKPFGMLLPPIARINNLVHARNADGRMAFTAPDQPYWNYAEKLSPGQTSQWHTWSFTIDPRVSYFYFAVSVFAPVPGENVVPATIPDGLKIPARYRSPAFLLRCDISGLNKCVYDAVDIMFQPGASLDQQEAAIEAVQGTVEGWNHGTQEYFVRVPGDSSFAGLKQALTTLRSFPQVKMAVPYGPIPMQVRYLRPIDGQNWTQWQVKDSLADGRNWALEAIDAPLAWGCDTGHDTLGIAIVDSDFHLVPDLQLSLIPTGKLIGMLTDPADSVDHGTSVSAIVAAAGDNRTDMTGVMWHASEPVYELATVDDSGQIRRDSTGQVETAMYNATNIFDAAVGSGATVINFSFGPYWTVWARERGYISSTATYDPGKETNPTRSAARDSLISQMALRIDQELTSLKQRGHSPLIVFAAGNEPISATWDPWSRMSAQNRNNVMLVGSVRNAGGGRLALSSWAARGDSLDIVAPGEDIWTLDHRGQLQRSGTSFSAPYVTGTAGLLLSFDPRLKDHGDSLKLLILEGAARGGRRVANGSGADSTYVLNAYEALKAAARRTGAPLCGNRLWIDPNGGALKAERAQGDEVLFTRPNLFAAVASHGGHRIDYYASDVSALSPAGTLRLVNNSWVDGAVAPSDGMALGAGQFARGLSHGGDTIASVHYRASTGATQADLFVRPTSNATWSALASYTAVTAVGTSPGTPAISPLGDKIAVAVSTSYGTCCGEFTYNVMVYDMTSKTSRSLFQVTGVGATVESFSEDGRELAVQYTGRVDPTPVREYHSAITGAKILTTTGVGNVHVPTYAPTRRPVGHSPVHSR